MCGIIAYIGTKPEATDVLLAGLRRLEYRGYDSAGIAVAPSGARDVAVSDDYSSSSDDSDESKEDSSFSDDELRPAAATAPQRLTVVKKKGKVANLQQAIDTAGVRGGRLGIGHTRWATHGEPSDRNSHPHTSGANDLAVVHNGIVENYAELRAELIAQGSHFRSETDSEVLAHLVDRELKRGDKAGVGDGDGASLEEALRRALRLVEGTFGVAVISAERPNSLVGARKGSPLVVGVGEQACLLSSDAAAVLTHTNKAIYLEDGDVVRIERDASDGGLTVALSTLASSAAVQRPVVALTLAKEDIERGGHKHFMIKEINDQPRVLRNVTRGRIDLQTNDILLRGLVGMPWDKLHAARRLVICACGTSWHAGLVGGYMIEQLARLPCRVEYASEFRYKRPILDAHDDVVLVISQSGETADTLAAVREAKAQGCLALGVVNTVGSTIARETDAGVYLHAGPEIGVASTKAFTAQVMVLAMLALKLGRARGHQSDGDFARRLAALAVVPEQIAATLERERADGAIESASRRCFGEATSALFLGRGFNFPVALEGALKLKECSYVHAEGYAAAEMKHGPIALIDAALPVVCIAPRSDSTYGKNKSNIEEVHARKGRVLVVTDEGNRDFDGRAECVLRVPATEECWAPLLTVVPLQLLSYHVADQRGLDVDKPRNLAKSVTVE